MPQETQQKTFKFVKSPKEEINFRAPLRLIASESNEEWSLFWFHIDRRVGK